MRRSVPILLALLAASPAVAAPPAQPPATPAKPAVDPAAVAAANRLLDAMDYDQLTTRMMDALIADAEQSLPRRLEASSKVPIPDDLKTKLTGIISDYMHRLAAANRPEMRQGTVLIYARHFTAAEIDHMVEMMRDPVMVKMQAQMPQIMTEAMALSQANMDREMPKMMEQLRAVIEDYLQHKGTAPAS